MQSQKRATTLRESRKGSNNQKMSDNKSPSFQFYANDFRSSSRVKLMGGVGRGSYIMLICAAWEDGSIPSDLESLAILADESLATFTKVWPKISPCFEPMEGDPTRLVQAKLERVREKQAERRDRLSQAGKNGSQKRWDNDGKPKGRLKPEGVVSGNNQAITETRPSLPSSSSSSSSSSGITPPPRAHDADAREETAPLEENEIPDLPKTEPTPIGAVSFARWFGEQAVAAGVAAAHHAASADAALEYGRGDAGFDFAKTLLAEYGGEECRAKALLLFADVAAKHQASPRIRWLSDRWDKLGKSRASSTLDRSEGSLYARVLAAERLNNAAQDAAMAAEMAETA